MSACFFQGNKDYCENTRNTDLMLQTFKKDRQKILQMLKENPQELTKVLWSPNSPICKDDNCLFQMGKSLKLSIDDILERKKDICDSLINFYICPQCKNMRRLIDFTKTRASEPFLIECGEYAGSSFICKKQSVNKTYLNYEKEPLAVKKAYSHPDILKLLKCSSCVSTPSCGLPPSCVSTPSCALPSVSALPSLSLTPDGLNELKKYQDLSYLETDSFTNNILINWFLQEQEHIPVNLSPLLMAWICNGQGYNLYQYLDISNITSFQDFPAFLTNSGKPSPTAKADDKSPISSEICKGIIMQLFAVLHSLRKFDFSHGNPSTNALKFQNESVSYILDGVHITCPVTLKLEDFGNSGCTVLENKIRLYSSSLIAQEQFKNKNINFGIDTIQNEDTQILTYRLKNPSQYIKESVMFMYMKHLGLPVYASSFDAYAFMVVLLCERSFHSGVMSNTILAKFWRDMWINDEDYVKVSRRISEYHETTSIITTNDVLKIISNLSLRCDMIDFGWNLIKSFNS